jgi:hypothetical protein
MAMSEKPTTPGAPVEAKDHRLVPEIPRAESLGSVILGRRPAKDVAGKSVFGLYNVWIILDDATQFNACTTEMVKSYNPEEIA